jgi:hypothetical protein
LNLPTGKREVYLFVANKRAGLISCNKRETLAHTHFTPVSLHQDLTEHSKAPMRRTSFHKMIPNGISLYFKSGVKNLHTVILIKKKK